MVTDKSFACTRYPGKSLRATMKLYSITLSIVALILSNLACSVITVKTTTTCGVAGFTQATDNTFLLMQDGTLDATIEFKDGMLRIYSEPEHKIFEEHPVPQGQDSAGMLQRFDTTTGYLIKEVDIVVSCDGNLFIRERIIDPPQPPQPPIPDTESG